MLWLQRGDQYRPEYLKLNPNAVVPTLVHDGKVIIESTLIMEYLDETFPEIPLMPGDPYARSQVRLWLKRVDELHIHCGTITTAVAFRRNFMRQSPDGRDACRPHARPGQARALAADHGYWARGTRRNGCSAALRYLRRRHG